MRLLINYLCILFLLLTLNSCKSIQISNEWFANPQPFYKNPETPRPFVILKNGEKVFAERIVMSKDSRKWVNVDGKDMKASQLKAVNISEGIFFAVIKNSFAIQTIRGRISLFVRYYSAASKNGFAYEDQECYSQKDGGEFKSAQSLPRLMELVKGCPKAEEKLAGGHFATLKRMRKTDPNLIFTAIRIYNNDCRDE